MVAVRQQRLRRPDGAHRREPGLDPAGQFGGFGVGPGQQQHVLATQVIGEPHRRGAIIGRFLIGPPDPAVPVVNGDHARVAVTEPDAGLPLPWRLEPADLLQLRGGDLAGQQSEHSPGPDGAELGSVAGSDNPRPSLPGRFADHGQIGRAELAGLIQHQHVVAVQGHGTAQLVGPFGLAEELGDVVALGQALVRQDPGRVGRGGQADDPAARERGP